MPLPIEDYPKLLEEYGRAFALINHIESTLNRVLKIKGGLANVNAAISNSILDDMMLGKKIKLAENILSSTLTQKLWELNKNRLLLAHGVAGVEFTVSNPASGTTVITHKQTTQSFTEGSLREVSKLAEELSEELKREITRG